VIKITIGHRMLVFPNSRDKREPVIPEPRDPLCRRESTAVLDNESSPERAEMPVLNTPVEIAGLIVMDVRPEEPSAANLLNRVYDVISFSSCPVLTVRTRAGVGLAQL
jgi:hypothetical protein